MFLASVRILLGTVLFTLLFLKKKISNRETFYIEHLGSPSECQTKEPLRVVYFLSVSMLKVISLQHFKLTITHEPHLTQL